MAKISGSDWLKSTGQKPIAVSLPPDQHQLAGVLAQQLGLRGRSELGRALFRWAIKLSDDPKKIQKILGESLDSIESRE